MRRLMELALGVALALVAGELAARALQPSPGSGQPNVVSPQAAAAPSSSVAPRASAPPVASAPPSSAPSAPTAAAPGPAAPRIGPRYDDDLGLAPHAQEVASYTLRVSLDPIKHDLVGEGTITWKNASSVPQREIWLHLYLNGFKNEKTVFLRTPLGGFRGDQPLSDWGWTRVKRLFARELDQDLWTGADKTTPGDADDETDIRVPLPREVAPGETLTLEVAWEAHLPALILRTGHDGSFHMVAQWFPKLARVEPDGRWAHFPFHRLSEFYADYGSYDVTIDVPESFVVGATGALQDASRADGRTRHRYLQKDVHDFAFTAWDRFQEKTDTMGGVAVRCLYPPGHLRAAVAQMEAVRHGLSHFGGMLGRYPYATLTVVHPPDGGSGAGGMEYPTLITTGGSWWLPYSGVRIIDIVAIHELGHQWFYGLVGTNEHAWPFLDEGLNSWAEVDALEAIYPGSSVMDTAGLRIGLAATHRAVSLGVARDEVVGRGSPEFPRGTEYGALVYSRTATVMLSLANVYGKEAVRRAIGRYIRRHRYEHPGPEELLSAIDEVLGAEASAAARSALLDGGWVDYSVDDAESRPSSAPRGVFGDPPIAATAAGDLPKYTGHALLRRHGAVVLPVDVELVSEDGSVQKVRWDGRQGTERLAWSGASPLAYVVIDPDHRVLLDLSLANNARAVQGPKPARNTLERATFFAGALLHAVAP